MASSIVSSPSSLARSTAPHRMGRRAVVQRRLNRGRCPPTAGCLRAVCPGCRPGGPWPRARAPCGQLGRRRPAETRPGSSPRTSSLAGPPTRRRSSPRQISPTPFASLRPTVSIVTRLSDVFTGTSSHANSKPWSARGDGHPATPVSVPSNAFTGIRRASTLQRSPPQRVLAFTRRPRLVAGDTMNRGRWSCHITLGQAGTAPCWSRSAHADLRGSPPSPPDRTCRD